LFTADYTIGESGASWTTCSEFPSLNRYTILPPLLKRVSGEIPADVLKYMESKQNFSGEYFSHFLHKN